MAQIRQVVFPPQAVSIDGLSTLAAGAYATSAAKDNGATWPLDLMVELRVTAGSAVAGNKQALLFALGSLDGGIFQTGANANDEQNMTLIGSLALPTNGASEVKQFTVAQCYGGVLPITTKFVVKNDSGSAFAAASLYVSDVAQTVS